MRSKLVFKINSYYIETKILILLLFFMPFSYYFNLIIQNGLGLEISVTALFYIIGFCLGIIDYSQGTAPPIA